MSRLIVFIFGGFDGVADVCDALQGFSDVQSMPDAQSVVAYLDSHPDVEVPFLIVNSTAVDVTSTLMALYADPRLAGARNVVLTDKDEHDDLAGVIDAGLLHSLVRVPGHRWSVPSFATSQVHAWMSDRGLDPVAVVKGPEAPVSGEASDLLRELGESDEEINEDLVEALDSAFSNRNPRLHLPAGVRLTRQGEEVRGVFILLEGNVALTRATPSEELLMHHASTGRVIGIISLAGEKQAFFTSTTTSDVVAIVLSLDQLKTALRRDPRISGDLAVSAIRGLSQRLLRSEALQVERNELNRALELERNRLTQALHDLEQARLELVSQAKFATLGELSAGIAHELNNPVAALTGAAQHIAEDIGPILQSHPNGALLHTVAQSIQNREPLSTAREREIRREIERRTKDPQMAFRLVAAGITDPELATRLSADDLEVVERAAGLTTSVRNIGTASTRISELVQSLRSYARPGAEVSEFVDVNATIEETLTLVAHRLRGLEIEREYGELMPIVAHPSQLGQMWTNLLVNAAEAMQGEGSIVISTAMVGDGIVRVDIADSGPGIQAENLERVFEPRFTTKQGTIRYGMGLGLGLTRSLVEAHGGTITVESEPGRTVFSVCLPTTGTLKEET